MLKKTDVINPVHPNRATRLFGGAASGILNWNDLKYSHLYNMREEIRANFYVSAEIQFGEMETHINQYEHYMNELMHSTHKQYSVQSEIAAVTSDPSVTSVFATMYDQLHEHIESVQRALKHFRLHIEYDVELDDVVKIEGGSTDLLLSEIVRLIELKLIGIEPPQELDGGSKKILEHIITDKINHILFLCELHDLTSKEYGHLRNEFVYNTRKYVLSIKDKDITAEKEVDGVDMDDFDDL